MFATELSTLEELELSQTQTEFSILLPKKCAKLYHGKKMVSEEDFKAEDLKLTLSCLSSGLE